MCKIYDRIAYFGTQIRLASVWASYRADQFSNQPVTELLSRLDLELCLSLLILRFAIGVRAMDSESVAHLRSERILSHCIKVIRFLHRNVCPECGCTPLKKRRPSAEYRLGQGASTWAPLLVRLDDANRRLAHGSAWVRLEARRSSPGPLPLGFRSTLPRTHTESRSYYKSKQDPEMTSVIRSYLSAMTRWCYPRLKLEGIRCLVNRSSRSRARS
jgi:hypothetical protein